MAVTNNQIDQEDLPESLWKVMLLVKMDFMTSEKQNNSILRVHVLPMQIEERSRNYI